MAEAEQPPSTPNLDFPLLLAEAVAWVVAQGFEIGPVRQAFEQALIRGRIHAGDQQGRNHFRELVPWLQAFAQRGAAEEDLTAISALGRGLAIPCLCWRKWCADRSLSWDTGKVIRNVGGHPAIFEPLLEGGCVLEVYRLLSSKRGLAEGQAQNMLPVGDPGTAQAAATHSTKRWVVEETKRMNGTGEIPKRITDFAKALAERMRKAAETDKSVRPVNWEHIKNHLPEWGCWPPSQIK